MSTIEIRMKFFASTREAVGMKEKEIEVDEGTTVSELVDSILQRYPAIEGDNLVIVVNKETSMEDKVLEDGDEVGFLPPVSGG